MYRFRRVRLTTPGWSRLVFVAAIPPSPLTLLEIPLNFSVSMAEAAHPPKVQPKMQHARISCSSQTRSLGNPKPLPPSHHALLKKHHYADDIIWPAGSGAHSFSHTHTQPRTQKKCLSELDEVGSGLSYIYIVVCAGCVISGPASPVKDRAWARQA